MPRKKQHEDIIRLYDRGYPVPIEFMEHIQREKWKRSGLVEVYQCPNAHIYKSEIALKALLCGVCGKMSKRIWSRSK